MEESAASIYEPPPDVSLLTPMEESAASLRAGMKADLSFKFLSQDVFNVG